VSAGYVLLRLPLEIKDLFEEWLGTHYPERKNHVMSLIRQTRDGAAYRAEWGARMRGTGPYADLIKQRFVLALRRHGLVRRSLDLDVSSFRPPPAPGDQLSLL
jgi:DNA repair photolyase